MGQDIAIRFQNHETLCGATQLQDSQAIWISWHLGSMWSWTDSYSEPETASACDKSSGDTMEISYPIYVSTFTALACLAGFVCKVLWVIDHPGPAQNKVLGTSWADKPWTPLWLNLPPVARSDLSSFTVGSLMAWLVKPGSWEVNTILKARKQLQGRFITGLRSL